MEETEAQNRPQTGPGAPRCNKSETGSLRDYGTEERGQGQNGAEGAWPEAACNKEERDEVGESCPASGLLASGWQVRGKEGEVSSAG